MTSPYYRVPATEDVRREAVAEARLQIDECLVDLEVLLRRHVALAKPAAGGVKHLLEQMERLLWLLGLSSQEAAFVRAACDESPEPGKPFAGLLVFADWLEDANRPKEAERVRALVPEDGDVLVLEMGPAGGADAREAARKGVEVLREWLASCGRVVNWAILPHGWDVRKLTPAMLLGSGLVLKRDADESLAELRDLRKENERLRDEVDRLQRLWPHRRGPRG